MKPKMLILTVGFLAGGIALAAAQSTSPPGTTSPASPSSPLQGPATPGIATSPMSPNSSTMSSTPGVTSLTHCRDYTGQVRLKSSITTGSASSGIIVPGVSPSVALSLPPC